MIVDTHLHLWDLTRSPYAWLTPAHGPLHRSFTPDEAWCRLAAAGIERAVLVQADDTLADTRLMLEIASQHDFVLAVVGWVPLDRPEDAAVLLEELAGTPLRGVRHLVHDDPRPDFLLMEPVQRGLRLLARHHLVLEVPDAWPRHVRQVEQVAAAHPDLTVVVDHLAKPPRGTDQMEQWAAELGSVARHPNTVAKFSGLQAAGQPFTVEALRPVLHTALELFGAERLMYGGDWPMTMPFGDYQAHWNVVRTLLSELSSQEQRQILAATAHRTYGEPAHD